MLAIQKPKGASQKCCPNALPCRVRHNGRVNASSRHWRPRVEADGSNTAYFRGRRLRGNVIKIPNEYEGVVLVKTDRAVRPVEPAPVEDERQSEDDDQEMDDEQEPETCFAMDQVASFDQLVTWGHESAPNRLEDQYAKGIDEWIKLAEAIHSQAEDHKK